MMRNYGLDNLKVILVMLVVCHHAALAYTLGEGWPIKDTLQSRVLSPMLAINASFFMGLFFFISGIFVPKSFEKSGTKKFIIDKVKRLLYPTILMSITLSFFLPYYLESGSYTLNIVANFIQSSFTFGHAWFLIVLFFLSAFYTMIASFMQRFNQPIFSLKYLLLIVILLSILTWVVSFQFPNNTWLFFHAVEPYHFPQYFILFLMGCLYSRLKDTLTLRTTYLSFLISIIAIILFVINFNMDFGLRQYFIIWKCILAILLSISLVGIFEKHANYKHGVLMKLSQLSFGVYITHVFTLIIIQDYLQGLDFPIMVKFGLSCLLGYSLSVIVVHIYYQMKARLLK